VASGQQAHDVDFARGQPVRVGVADRS
jgi:hypothetical protein